MHENKPANAIRVARLTPPGRGAIATLAVDGPGAARLVALAFTPRNKRPLTEAPSDRPVFGDFRLDESTDLCEEMIVRVLGADSVELHCHGGPAVVARVERTLQSLGAECLVWTRRSNEQEHDPIRRAALEALSETPTERTAAALLHQYNGALRAELDRIVAVLQRGDTNDASHAIKRLMQAGRSVGMHLALPWRVAISGPPNAGKSSLINRVVGFDRAIVHHEPGTTRDVVTASVILDGWPFELCDTAGLRETDHAIEREGVAMAAAQLRDADLVVLVFDRSADWTEACQSLVDGHPTAIIVLNKCDLPPASKQPSLSERDVVAVSASTGEGVDDLLSRVVQHLIGEAPPVDAPLPFTPAQIDALDDALNALQEEDTRRASDVLVHADAFRIVGR